jgi:hypothetical protein
VARRPEDIPGFDRLSPRAKLILTGNSVYDRPVDQRGTVSQTASTSQSSSQTTPQVPAKKTIQSLKLSMSQARDVIGSPALTNHYYIDIPLLPNLKDYVKYKHSKEADQIINFVNRKLGFFCSEATLPVSSYATAEVKDNFMGVPQEFAHTRLYTDLDFTFYVDHDYNILRYFELWMDFISSGAEHLGELGNIYSQYNEDTNYYRRFRFPNEYKSNRIKIVKFERDYKTGLFYQFVNAFPKGLTSIPVSYGSAELLKVTVTFNFDRYIVERDSIKSISSILSPEENLERLTEQARSIQENP